MSWTGVFDYSYSYLGGALIFTAAWAVLYLFAKSHRGQMLWGTALAAPFAFTSFLFIPEYWSPPSLFDLAMRYGVSIEDVVWSAAVGGIASVVSEVLFHDRLERMRAQPHKRRYKPLLLIVAVFAVLELLYPAHSIYGLTIALAAGAAYMAIIRRDLAGRMLRGAAIFTATYLLLFAYFLAVYPEFIARYYNVAALWGVYVAGIPIEEPLFAFSGGAVWTVVYEYMQGYRLTGIAPPRLAGRAG
jgi:hypothetical protein